MVAGLRAATALLTRIPMTTTPDVGRGAPWLPIVGGLIGATTAGVYAAAHPWTPPLAAATIATIAAIALTGGLHEDGLADCADGFWGASTPQRRREILKDPRHGTFGVSAIVADLMLRVSLLAALGPLEALGALVVAAALGRASAVAIMLTGRPAAGPGIGASAITSLRRRSTVVGMLVAATGAATIGRWWGVAAVAASAIVALAIGRLSVAKIGGVVGDSLGSAARVSEQAVMLIAVGVMLR